MPASSRWATGITFGSSASPTTATSTASGSFTSRPTSFHWTQRWPPYRRCAGRAESGRAVEDPQGFAGACDDEDLVALVHRRDADQPAARANLRRRVDGVDAGELVGARDRDAR